MASSFGGTIKLTGESEYKKALSSITDNLKVLNSEMKVVTSQYDKNDKSVSNLSKQNSVLTKKIDEQKQKVNTLKDALASAKKETGENSTTTKKWQTDLNNAQAELNKLEHELVNNKNEIKNFGKAEEEAGENSTRLGDIIKGNLISSAIIGGIKALGNAVKEVGSAILNVGKEALNSYADYEQLVGGVETLFGESSGKVQKYAAAAYETAGMNANDYMETVTSFSASLLQSLKGNTDKAAESANQALIDMSDNANKMGTDMSMIQSAYQGFAKQNYTMLDNLKLGYGGTKTEMERLLKDAQKISGVKYDINNLNDVYSAIHVIQTELGITGTTAKEASTTIQGSITSMKSAYSNLLTRLADENADLTELSLNLVYSTETAIKNIIPTIQKIISGIAEALPQVIAEIGSQVPQLLEVGIDMARSLLDGINGCLFNNENGMGLIAVATSIIEKLINGIIELLPDIIKTGMDIILGLVQGLSESLPELIPTIIDAMLTIVDTLLDNIDLIIDTGIQLLIGLSDGLIEALPKLIDKIPTIIDKIINAIANNLPKIIETGITITIELAKGLIKAIPQLISKIPQIISSLINGFKIYYSNMGEVGKNLVSGIWDGIKNAKDWLFSKIKEWCGNMLDGIKSFFGIHSPSKVFKDEIGTNLALGVGEGFSNTMRYVSQEMANSIPTEFDVNSTINSKNTLNQLNLENLTTAFVTAVKNINAQIIIDRDVAGRFIITSVNNRFGEIYG